MRGKIIGRIFILGMKKITGILIVMISILCLFPFACSRERGQKPDRAEDSTQETVRERMVEFNHTIYDEVGRPEMRIEGEGAVKEENTIVINHPRVWWYGMGQGEVVTTLEAEEGQFNPATGSFHAAHNVVVSRGNESRLEAGKLRWEASENVLSSEGTENVRITYQKSLLNGKNLEVSRELEVAELSDVTGRITTPTGDHLFIESADRGMYNQKEKWVRLEGRVEVTYFPHEEIERKVFGSQVGS